MLAVRHGSPSFVVAESHTPILSQSLSRKMPAGF